MNTPYSASMSTTFTPRMFISSRKTFVKLNPLHRDFISCSFLRASHLQVLPNPFTNSSKGTFDPLKLPRKRGINRAKSDDNVDKELPSWVVAPKEMGYLAQFLKNYRAFKDLNGYFNTFGSVYKFIMFLCNSYTRFMNWLNHNKVDVAKTEPMIVANPMPIDPKIVAETTGETKAKTLKAKARKKRRYKKKRKVQILIHVHVKVESAHCKFVRDKGKGD